MSLTNAILKDGASAMTPTGGADMTFTPNGQSVTNGIAIANAAQTDFRIRENATLKNRLPVLNSLGKYSKDKKTLVYAEPKILADGSTVFNLIRIEREVHPESTAAEALNLCMMGAQWLTDSDVAAFWSAGSLA